MEPGEKLIIHRFAWINSNKARLFLFAGLLVVLVAGSSLLVMVLNPFERCVDSKYAVRIATPDYLGEVWPGPDGVISLACYRQSNLPRKGLGVEIIVLKTDRFPPSQGFPDSSTLPLRTKLILDGRVVPKNVLEVMTTMSVFYVDGNGMEIPIGPGSYYFNWDPFLNRGKHIARVEIVNNEGDTLVYTWNFTIK